MPLSELPAWVENIGSALVGLSVGGYTISRIYRRDSNIDKIDDKSQKLIDNLSRQIDLERESYTGQIKYERDTNMRLGETIDRLSAERNEAIQNVGRLEGQITALSQAVEHLRSEVERLTAANQGYADEIGLLRTEIASWGRAGGDGDGHADA